LREHQFQPSKHALCREWFAESSPQFGQTTTSVPKQWVVIAHAKRCQNSSDPVGQTDARGDEFGPFANTPSSILMASLLARAAAITLRYRR